MYKEWKLFIFYFFLGGGCQVGGGQGGCEWRSEAFVKIQKKIKKKFLGGGGGWGVGSGGCQVWGGGSGVWVDVNGEVKLL